MKANVVRIPDPLLAEGQGQQGYGRPPRRMGMAWGVGNTITVFPKSDETAEKAGGQRPILGTPVQVHKVEWETTLFQSVFRKLVNESSQTFLTLQKLANSEEEAVTNAQLVHISRQYRSILRDCQERLDEEENSPSAAQQSELLYKLELIWNLMEILQIQRTRVGVALPQLLQWIMLHFRQCDDMTKNILNENLERPETHPDYWSALTLFLLQGRNDQALKLLRLHSDFSTDPFISLDELLRKMPIYNSSMSVPDFDYRWNHWHNEVVSRLEAGEFADPEVARVASLLAGSETAFSEIASKCETWYQWMCGKLLYTNPIVKIYDLSYHAEQAINQFGGLNRMTSLDSVLLATIEADVSGVMHELCTTLDNFWFPAHLLDLIHHVDNLENSMNPNYTAKAELTGLREFLLLEYATSLMSHRSLWQVGVLYFDHCPVQGRYRLELLLERMAVDNETRANKIITIALERGIASVVCSTCKVMGMKMLKDNRIGAAMAWGLRSQDVKFTTFLADKLLSQYCEEGGFSSTDLLDNLGSCMMVSDRLTFLAKYREFHKLCSNSDFTTAANLLHSLLWSRLAPKYFWVTLLIDASSFLNAEEVLFTSEQIYELMHCLQELTTDTNLPKKQKMLLDEHEGKIRMKLAKNLAMALMEEGDSTASSGIDKLNSLSL